MPYWKCFYHIVWATRYREPTILPVYEPVILAEIARKSAEYGCELLAANCASDHVHVAVSIRPSIAVADYVGNIKGASSRAINTSFERETRFHWQEGYSVLSFGERALPFVRKYIAEQKEHHANDTVNRHLERIDD